MDADYRSWHYMIGKLHITFYDHWQGFDYANFGRAEGWSWCLGFVMFWGSKTYDKLFIDKGDNKDGCCS